MTCAPHNATCSVMTSIREFIPLRRSEIKEQIKALKAELFELDAIELNLPSLINEDLPTHVKGTKGTGQKTLKEMAVEALMDNPEGLTTRSILEKIKDRHGVIIQRESLSPQLSRLSADNVVLREGFVWRLAQQHMVFSNGKTQKNETPDARTSDVPELDELFG